MEQGDHFLEVILLGQSEISGHLLALMGSFNGENKSTIFYVALNHWINKPRWNLLNFVQQEIIESMTWSHK